MQENEEYVFSRYRWSFTARLHQAPEPIAQYYSEIKNAFLGYKKVKSRISWNCDSINFGREKLSKLVLTTKTLYVYRLRNKCSDMLVPISMVGTLGWAQWSTIDLAVIVTPRPIFTIFWIFLVRLDLSGTRKSSKRAL